MREKSYVSVLFRIIFLPLYLIGFFVPKNNKIWVQAGGGIVYDSDPEMEFQETENKAAAVITALGIKVKKE